MKIRVVEVTVGAFVLAGILSLAMLALKVSGLHTVFQDDHGYHVRVEFSNVGGLKIRSKVTMGGVLVGRVSDISLDPESFNATVSLVIDNRFPNIPSDSRASILTAGLLGDNYISLAPGFSDTPLKEGDRIVLENTDSAMILEQLVEKFLGQKASEGPDENHEKKK
ncbi:MAG: outer rane lipid asymmetry maintenance protein MlaD [Pseudomonadota bacterium]|jgi:phospholipid/cholesterol/gamma-HCH transport system substrate-binding protein